MNYHVLTQNIMTPLNCLVYSNTKIVKFILFPVTFKHNEANIFYPNKKKKKSLELLMKKKKEEISKGGRENFESRD